MALTFKAAQLLSRTIRINASQGKTGSELLKAATGKPALRKIGSLIKLENKAGEQKGILDFVWDKAKNFTGWLASQAMSFLSFSASAIFAGFVAVGTALWNFDWNQSDEEIAALTENSNIALAGLWGSVVGQGIGWMAAIGIGYGISYLCPVIGGAALAKLVASKAAAEGLEELGATFKNALISTAKTLAANQILSGYSNIRRVIKGAPKEVLETFFGKSTADFIKNKWGAKDGPNMSFSTQLEEKIEKIPNKALRAFLENALEEGWDSFCEAGFVIAYEIDNAYSQQKLQNKNSLGTERTIQLLPDKQNKDEKLTFANVPQNLLMPAVQQTLNTHRMIGGRDVGMMIGMPVDDYARANDQTLRLVIAMMSLKRPPYRRRSTVRLIRVTLTVPDVRRSAVDWEKVKTACGGVNGYLWGRFRATANLSNKRQMAVYGATEDEAKDRLEALLQLTDAKLVSLTITEEKKAGKRLENPKLQKETTRVYPAYMTVINREEILERDLGKASLSQNYRDKKGRVELWPEREPADAKEIIRRLLTKGV